MPHAPYAPQPLGNQASAGYTELASRAVGGHLVLYLGAGVSAAPPTCGPLGNAVADALRWPCAQILGCDEADLAGTTLEDLSQRIADSGLSENMAKLRERAAIAFDFAGFEPNYGHRAVALLMREGLAKVVSANWDCAVELAGIDIRTEIAAVTSTLTAHVNSNGLQLYKLHGCAKSPQTLRMTTTEVDTPEQWAIAQVQSALTTGTVAFVGLATVGSYVSKPIDDVLQLWRGYASSIRVVDTQIPPSWAAILGNDLQTSHLQVTSDLFFDNLLCAVVDAALLKSSAQAHALAAIEQWAVTMANGNDHFIDAMRSAPAHTILEWLREGASSTQVGRPFVTETSGQNALLTLSLLIGRAGSVSVSGMGRGFSVSTSTDYLEILWRPQAHFVNIEPIAEALTTRKREEGVYAVSQRVTIILVDARGSIPAPDAESDIAGSDIDLNDIAGETSPPIRYYSAEAGVQGRI